MSITNEKLDLCLPIMFTLKAITLGYSVRSKWTNFFFHFTLKLDTKMVTCKQKRSRHNSSRWNGLCSLHGHAFMPSSPQESFLQTHVKSKQVICIVFWLKTFVKWFSFALSLNFVPLISLSNHSNHKSGYIMSWY